MDIKKIEEGVRMILEGIGEDPEREGLLETPERYARMCQQVFGGLTQTPDEHLKKQFTVENNKVYAITGEEKLQVKLRLYQIEEMLDANFVKINTSNITEPAELIGFPVREHYVCKQDPENPENDDLTELLKYADSSLYDIKNSTKCAVKYYEKEERGCKKSPVR